MYFGLYFSISRVLKLLSRVRLGKLVEMIYLQRQNVVAWLNSQTVKSIRQIIVAALKCQMFLFDNVNTLLLRRYVNCFIFLKSKRGCFKIKLFIFLTVKRCCYKETANSSFSNVNMFLLERNVNCFIFLTSKRCYWEPTSNVSCSYVKSLLLNLNVKLFFFPTSKCCLKETSNCSFFKRQNVVAGKKRQSVVAGCNRFYFVNTLLQ